MSRQPLGRRVLAWQRQTLCATVMATGETLDFAQLRCRCNLEYRFAYADGKSLDRPRQLWCVEPARSAVSSTFNQTEIFTLDSCKMAGEQAILQVSFVSLHMIEISLGQRIRELREGRLILAQIGGPDRNFPAFPFGHRTWKTIPFRGNLSKASQRFGCTTDELKQYDARGPIADLKRLMDSDPKLGFAFRTVVEKVKNGELTAEINRARENLEHNGRRGLYKNSAHIWD
jgi:hypothetical protein